MIKINLIKVKKKPEIPLQLYLAVFTVIAVVFMLSYIWFSLKGELKMLKEKSVSLQNELIVLKNRVKEVKNFEEDKKKYEDNIEVIKRLRTKQSIPVRLLDEISRNLPSQVWLVLLTENEGKTEIEGNALSNASIVEFINNLKRSSFFKEIHLVESRQIMEQSTPIYRFKLKCNITL
ncbi:MAG: PilN domain-containing protein [Nitrospirota bacterium]